METPNPTTFSILDRLLNRGMPEEDATIYLDEKLGWVLQRLEEKHAATIRKEELPAIEADIAAVKTALADAAYTVTMRGMTNERYDELVDVALESYPYEYEENFNPMTGQKLKSLIPSEERDTLFDNLFLAESMVKITDPSGAVDENITIEVATQFKRLAPVDAIRRLGELAARMRMTGEWMNEVETEDFSPKP